MNRGQSSVIGVALLVTVTVIGIGALTASVGLLVEESATAASTERVAEDLENVFESGAVGNATRRLTLGEGRLYTVDRTVRVLRGGTPVATEQVDAVVYTAGERRVTALAGTVVRGNGTGATFRVPPTITADRATLVVSLVSLENTVSIESRGVQTVALRTTADHHRDRLERAPYRIAVETATPAPWERFFDRRGVATTRNDFDGDGVQSVVADYGTNRRIYLLVTDLRVEVDRD